MKLKSINIYIVFAAVLMITACKKETFNAPEYAKAYFRMIVMDAPGGTSASNFSSTGKIQFTLDGKVNANGDSVIHNPDGSVYQEDSQQLTTSTLNYPAGGWSDNSPLSFVGVYGYYYTNAHFFSCFPNPSNRIDLAPIYNGLNFFNWAAVPAAQHRMTFYGVVTGNLYGNNIAIRGPQFYDQQLNLEGGALQTFMLVNKAACKTYVAAGVNTQTGFPYAMTESVRYFSENFDLVSFKDHPDKLPAFKDTSAYVRFMNMTPVYADQTLNQNADSLDIYLAPIYGRRPNYYYTITTSIPAIAAYSNDVTSVGTEVLVAKGLARFRSYVDQPFIEIPLGRYMKKAASGMPDTVGLPRYFRVLAYRSGQSKAKGFAPLAFGDWLSIYNRFDYFSPATQFVTAKYVGTSTDSFLLRYDGSNYHPTITTIPIAVGQDPQPLLGSAYLSYRSIINYIPAGVNAVYYK